jgi:outer membrane protein insertion porin family
MRMDLSRRKFYFFICLAMLVKCLAGQTQMLGQAVVNTVEFSGQRHFSTGQLLKRSGLKTGMVYTDQMVRAASQNIIAAYKQDGFLYARIDSVSCVKINDREMTLIWHVDEDKSFHLGKIDIQNEVFPREILLDQLDMNTGDIYREDLIETELRRISLFFAQRGYPLAVIKPGQVVFQRNNGFYTVDLPLLVDAGRKVTINEFSITGNHITRDRVILRELGIHRGDLYDQDKIDQISQNLNRLGFFKNVQPPVVLIKDSVTTLLKIAVEEGNTTTFDGIVGYIPAETGRSGQQGYFTGLIQLGFRNLFGTGRRFDVNWKKPDRYSDEFRLFYEEPWIFDLPVNLGLSLERVVRDTTYIERAYSLISTIRFNSNFRVKFQLMTKSTIPDSAASKILRLTNNSVLSGDFGLEYDSRDHPYNPRRGLLYHAYYSVGVKKNYGPVYLLKEDSLAGTERLQSIRLDFAYLIGLSGNQVLSGAFSGKRINSNRNRLQISDHFWFGGTNTLRGYRENQFHGTTVAWCNLEYRFLTGRDSRIFVFNDWGYYYYRDTAGKHEDVLPGYGLGLRFGTPLGVLGVDYGLGRGDTFSTGKIHFSIVNMF